MDRNENVPRHAATKGRQKRNFGLTFNNNISTNRIGENSTPSTSNQQLQFTTVTPLSDITNTSVAQTYQHYAQTSALPYGSSNKFTQPSEQHVRKRRATHLGDIGVNLINRFDNTNRDVNTENISLPSTSRHTFHQQLRSEQYTQTHTSQVLSDSDDDINQGTILLFIFPLAQKCIQPSS